MALKAADLANKSKVFNEIQHVYSAATGNYQLKDLKPNEGQTTWQAPPQDFVKKAASDSFSVIITAYHSSYRVDMQTKDKQGKDIVWTVGSLGHA